MKRCCCRVLLAPFWAARPLWGLLIAGWATRVFVAALAAGALLPSAPAAPNPPVAQFHKEIEPILTQYCFDCHADGVNKGGVAFDDFASDSALLDNRDLWWTALKYLRAGIMPPEKRPHPSDAQKQQIAAWIKSAVFQIDPDNLDPGRVTLRRLNRVEYHNTIRDLLGVDFNTDVEFPPDDTGYGFDDIGDVLSLSPMLFEKYVAAAKTIVAEAVPTVPRAIREVTIPGARFRDMGGADEPPPRRARDSVLTLPYDQPAAVAAAFNAGHAGTYQLSLVLGIHGGFDYDPGQCRVTVRVDDHELLMREFGWQDNKTLPAFQFTEKLPAGAHHLNFILQPLKSAPDETNGIEMRLVSLTVRGALEKEFWDTPKNYDRFFPKEIPPSPPARRDYAREILRGFAGRAFRRPVDDQTVERFAKFAEAIYTQPGKSFEQGIAGALAGVIASPRFLFHVEESAPHPAGAKWADVDEYSLASRLSYFLWSTMPDEPLTRLAARGELRNNLDAQVRRMLADPRSEALAQNFTGQWLQLRDLNNISIDARTVLARDDGKEKELREQLESFHARFAANPPHGTNTSPPNAQHGLSRGPQFPRPRFELTADVRQAMRSETEMFFSSIIHDDRSVTDLINADYTFLNGTLAKFYGLTNLNITGPEMRRVPLPPDCARGGVLTDGAVLVVTSNPDRTSPVKRGLFVLNNILGTPAPPPPPNIPALEASEANFKDHAPTLRAVLAVHRDQPLCASCHGRMDPIGLGMENFDALGLWRTSERGQPIEAAGQLITGESFDDVRQLKQILATKHRDEFYRCLTEKLLTYALGRGLDYYDVGTVDAIVARLDQENGRFSALLMGVIDSAPFQEMRNEATPPFSKPAESNKDVASAQNHENSSTP